LRTVSIARDGRPAARAALEDCVREGGVAVFPADTLYGLACDPQNPKAIERVHALKGRDDRKPAAVMFFAPLAMRDLLVTLGPRTREALGALLPGPVTLVVENRERRYPLACREDPERLGIRLIEGPLAGARCAIFQTSANPSGGAAPSRLEDVDPVISKGVDLVIDGGEVGGAPSTVVDLTGLDRDGSWRLLRKGALDESSVGERVRGALSGGSLTRAGDPGYRRR
jgi:L-threonylcarbamoyladenylate synthase